MKPRLTVAPKAILLATCQAPGGVCTVCAIRTGSATLTGCTALLSRVRISVINVKGGVGKTTSTVYLAALLADTIPVLLTVLQGAAVGAVLA